MEISKEVIDRILGYLEGELHMQHEYKRNNEQDGFDEEAEENQETINDLTDLIATLAPEGHQSQ